MTKYFFLTLKKDEASGLSENESELIYALKAVYRGTTIGEGGFYSEKYPELCIRFGSEFSWEEKEIKNN